MNTTLTYSVQIITQDDQLTEALNLRYRIYKKVYPKITENNIRPFESDAFDWRSIHLGLFCNVNGDKKLAGYCRLILPKAFQKQFSYLLIRNHTQYLQQKEMYNQKLAFMERLSADSFQKVSAFCNQLENAKIPYIETSRFIIGEEHRSISLSTFFASSMFAVCDSLKIKYTFFTCPAHHVSFYNKLGLTLFPGVAQFDNQIFGTQFVVFGTKLNVANTLQKSITSFREELECEKQITFRKAE